MSAETIWTVLVIWAVVAVLVGLVVARVARDPRDAGEACTEDGCQRPAAYVVLADTPRAWRPVCRKHAGPVGRRAAKP